MALDILGYRDKWKKFYGDKPLEDVARDAYKRGGYDKQYPDFDTWKKESGIDADIIADNEKRNPIKTAPMRLAKSFVEGGARGLTTELPSMVGGAIEFAGSHLPGKAIEETGKTIKDWADEKAMEWYAPEKERTGLDRIVYEGTKMLAPSIVPGGIVLKGARAAKGIDALLKAGKIAEATKAANAASNIASGSVAGLFGLSQAQQTRDTANQQADQLEAQGDYEGVRKARAAGQGIAPIATGAIEAAGEFFGTKYLGKLFGLSEAEVAKRGVAEFAKDLLKTLGVEVGTEIGQASGESAVEKYSGIRPDAQPLQEAIDVIGPTAFMTLLTGGLAGAANKLNSKDPKEKEGAEALEKQKQGALLSLAINEGLKTGQLDGKPFTNDDALQIMRDGRKKGMFSQEDIDRFHEYYPGLKKEITQEFYPDIYAKEQTKNSYINIIDTGIMTGKYEDTPIERGDIVSIASEGYKQGLFTPGDLDDFSKKYPGMRGEFQDLYIKSVLDKVNAEVLKPVENLSDVPEHIGIPPEGGVDENGPLQTKTEIESIAPLDTTPATGLAAQDSIEGKEPVAGTVTPAEEQPPAPLSQTDAATVGVTDEAKSGGSLPTATNGNLFKATMKYENGDFKRWEDKENRIEFELNPPEISANPGPYWEGGIRHKGWAQEAKKFKTKEEAIKWLDEYDIGKIDKEGWGPGKQFLDEMFGTGTYEKVKERVTSDNEAVIKTAIADAKKNGPSNEFRALFGGIEPTKAGTTNEAVGKLAKKLGLSWEAPTAGQTAKEPWQMTWREYVAANKITVGNLEEARKEHAAIIGKAISEGKNILDAVMESHRENVAFTESINKILQQSKEPKDIKAAGTGGKRGPGNKVKEPKIPAAKADAPSVQAVTEPSPAAPAPRETKKEDQEFAAKWDALGYEKRQDIAQASVYGKQRAVVHRLSGSKWADVSSGEQEELRKTADSMEKPAPVDSGEKADIQKEINEISDEALDAMIDATPKASEEKEEKPAAPKAPRAPREKKEKAAKPVKSVDEIIADIAKEGVEGVGESMKGLYELFGGASIKSFPGAMDEDTYAKAKPHFTAALEHFIKVGKGLKEFAATIIKQFGDNIRPYLKRFVQEKRDESKAEKEAKKAAAEEKKAAKAAQGNFQNVGYVYDPEKLNAKIGDKPPKTAVRIILDEMVPSKVWSINHPEGATPGTIRLADKIQGHIKTFKDYLLEDYDRLKSHRRRRDKMDDVIDRWISRGNISWDDAVKQMKEWAAEYGKAVQPFVDAFQGTTGITNVIGRIQDTVLAEAKQADGTFPDMAHMPIMKAPIFADSRAFSNNYSIKYLYDFLTTGWQKMVDEENDTFLSEINVHKRGRNKIVVRTGLPDYREGVELKNTEAFNAPFGFKGVGFGEEGWINQEERNRVIPAAYDAFKDLAATIGAPDTGMSIGGQLAVQFANLGHKAHGAAAAYFPTVQTMNFTRDAGDGCFAHEWGHGLHDLAGPEASGEINNIIESLKYIYDFEAGIRMVDDLLAKDSPFLKRLLSSKKQARIEAVKGEAERRFTDAVKMQTDYYATAKLLDGDYTARGQEMWARAFEAYVYDTLGGTNNYLVSDFVAAGRVGGASSVGTKLVYPSGKEREAFAETIKHFTDGLDWSSTGQPSLKDDYEHIEQLNERRLKEELVKLLDSVEERYKAIWSSEPSSDGHFWYQYDETAFGPMMQPDGYTGYDKSFKSESQNGSGAVCYLTQLHPDAILDYKLTNFKYEGESPTYINQKGGVIDDSIRGDGTEALDEVSTEDDSRPKEERDIRGGDDRGGSESEQGTREAGKERSPVGSGEGDSIEGIHPAPAGNYRITDPTLNDPKSAEIRFRKNLAAIKLLKQIEGEGRSASPGTISFGEAPPGGWTEADKVPGAMKEMPNEKEILAGYTGWGGMAELFSYSPGQAWQGRSDLIKAELTEAEMNSAASSSTSAYYTPVPVGQFMWHLAQRLGFTKGLMLDPATGANGLFLGTMPDDLRQQGSVTLHGIEMDDLSARIASKLYELAAIETNAFQDAKKPINRYDLTMTNVPFENIAPSDVKHNKGKHKLHNYYINKMIDLTAPGGLTIAITTANTMDSGGAHLAEYAKKAEFVGAIRLPSNIYNATGVVTDILVFRKNIEGSKFKGIPAEEWTTTGADESTGLTVNNYFLKHPDMVAGKLEKISGRYGDESLRVVGEGDLIKNLENIAAAFPGKIVEREAVAELKSLDDIISAPGTVKEGGLYINDKGIVCSKHDGQEHPMPNATPADKNRVEVAKGFIKILDQVRTVLRSQRSNEDDAVIKAHQAQLKKEYDTFVKKHGAVNKPKNADVYNDITDASWVMALEDYDQDTDKVTGLADIFTKNIAGAMQKPTHAESDHDALAMSLDEFGYPNLEYMARLRGSDVESVSQGVMDKIVEDPETGFLVTMDEYLSGNVKRKLTVARDMAESNPDYERNVKLLEAAQPPEIPAHRITARIGASWVFPEHLSDFVKDKLNLNDRRLRAIFSFNPITNEWSMSYRGKQGGWKNEVKAETQRAIASAKNSVEATKVWGTDRMNFLALIECALMGKRPVVTYPVDGKPVMDPVASAMAEAKLLDIQNEFGRWIFEDPTRAEEAVKRFNDIINTSIPPKADGSHLTFPGKSLAMLTPKEKAAMGVTSLLSFYPHQMNAVWKYLRGGNMYLAHEVGAGKTMTMALIAMEAKRLRGKKKVLYVTLNDSTMGQAVAEIKKIYPLANILPVRVSTAGERQRRALQKIALNDFDIAIMRQQDLDRIQLSPEAERVFIDEELVELRELLEELKKAGSRILERDIQERIHDLEERLKAPSVHDDAKQKNICFDDLGIDLMIVDEAHAYKNVPYATRLTRITGLNPAGSPTAKAFFRKTQYLNAQFPKHDAVVLASGTALSNSIAELYNIQRMLQPQEVKRQGVQSFDRWISNFGDMGSQLEWDGARGQYKVINTNRRIVNAGRLLATVYQNVDSVRAKDTPIKRPVIRGGEPIRVKIAPNQYVDDYKGVVLERCKALDADPRHAVYEGIPDNMLRIISNMSLVAIDQRLLTSKEETGELDAKGRKKYRTIPGPYANTEMQQDSKIFVASNTIYRRWQEEKEHKGVQLVFADFGIPKRFANNLYYEDGKKFAVLTDEKIAELSDDKHAEYTELLLEHESSAEGRFNTYDGLKEELVKLGIPASQIAFIHDADNVNKEKKAANLRKLFKKVNAGEIRVLIGSTSKAGTGVNIQERVSDVHHIDVWWNYSAWEQRNGRAIRAGNLYADLDGVYIHNYATETTVDATRWDKIFAKGKVLNATLGGDINLDVIEDISEDTMSAKMMAADASGNPLMAEHATIMQSVQALKYEQAGHLDMIRQSKMELARIPDFIAANEKVIADCQRSRSVMEKVTAVRFVNDDRTLVLDKHGKEIAEALQKAIEADATAWQQSKQAKLLVFGSHTETEKEITDQDGKKKKVKEYQFVPVTAHATVLGMTGDPYSRDLYVSGNIVSAKRPLAKIEIKGKKAIVTIQANISRTVTEYLSSLNRQESDANSNIARGKADEPKLKKVIDTPWEKTKELTEKLAKLADVETRLAAIGSGADNPEKGVAINKYQAQIPMIEDVAPTDSWFRNDSIIYPLPGYESETPMGVRKDIDLKKFTQGRGKISPTRRYSAPDNFWVLNPNTPFDPYMSDVVAYTTIGGDTKFWVGPMTSEKHLTLTVDPVKWLLLKRMVGEGGTWHHVYRDNQSHLVHLDKDGLRDAFIKATREMTVPSGVRKLIADAPTGIADIHEKIDDHQYYASVPDGFDKVDGEDITIAPWLNGIFIYQREDGKWSVTEKTTGMSLSTREDKDEAIEAAEVAVKNAGEDKVKASIASGLEKNGGTPYYKSLTAQYRIVNHGTASIWAPEPGFPHGRPRLDKIGTGEGGAANGYGWYSAEAEEVARIYKDILARTNNQRAKVRRDGHNYIVEVVNPEDDEQFFVIGKNLLYSDAIELREEWNAKNAGSLYKIDIPDDILPKLLDWDKPLSEQNEYVRKALDKALRKIDAQARQRILDNQTAASGAFIYNQLTIDLGSDKAASEYLRSIGIPGNKYLDQKSRGKGEWIASHPQGGENVFYDEADANEFMDRNPEYKLETPSRTYNYVLWDQTIMDRVAMLERNGTVLDAIREAEKANAGDAFIPTLADVQGIFKGQDVQQNSDGSFLIGTAAGQVIVKGVDRIDVNPDRLQIGYSKAKLSDKDIVAGKYEAGEIQFVRGVGDKLTLAHESIHFMEDIGVLIPSEVNLLKRHIQGLAAAGKFTSVNKEDVGGKEDRANFLGKALIEKPKGLIGRIVNKIQDFIDKLVNAFGIRTVKGITRDVKTGDIYNRPAAAQGTGRSYNVATMAEPFYSQLLNTVTTKLKEMPSKIQSIPKWLERNQVKPAEMKWMGVDQWLKENAKDGAIDKQKFADFLKVNQIEIKEVTKGNMETRGLSEGEERRFQELLSRQTDFDETREFKRLKQKRNKIVDPTKFSQYVMPGGENYRELLLTLPAPKDRMEFDNFIMSMRQKYGDHGTAWIDGMTDSEHAEYDRLQDQWNQPVKKEYQSAHWEEPNVLAHVRMNDRVDADGKKILFIEEVQSDWHQEGKKKGYAKETDKYNVVKSEKYNGKWVVVRDGNQEVDVSDRNYYGIFPTKELAHLHALNLQKDYKLSGRVPAAPFAENWHELLMKRMLRYAAENGYEKLAWTTSKQQIERYWDNDIVSEAVARFKEVTKPQSVRELADDVLGAKMASLMTLNPVDGGMLTALENNKVKGIVISNLPIDVVNILKREKISPDKIFSQNDMVINSLPVDSRAGVADGIISAIRDTGTTIRTKLSGLSLGGREIFLYPTLKASDLNQREVAGIIAPSSIFHFGRNISPEEATSTGAVAKSLSPEEARIFGGKFSPTKLAEFLNAHIEIISGKEGIVKQGFEAPPGEGMKSFYDNLIPGFMRKYVAQWGAKVGESVINTKPLKVDEKNDSIQLAETETVPSVDITPQMKQDVLFKGQAYYSVKDHQDPPASKDPKVLNQYLKDETDAVVQTIMNKLHPKQMTWLETMLKSPEWFGHPAVQRIVSLFVRDRNELYHETFNHLNLADDIDAPENTVTEAGNALKGKGLSIVDRIAGKESAEYKMLARFIDHFDTSWKKDKNKTLAENMKACEDYMKKNGATEDVIKVWRLYRESYDKALVLLTRQMEELISRLKEQASFRGEEADVAELQQTLKFALAEMKQWEGFYAPRLREAGDWAVRAYKEHGPLAENREYYREHRGSELSAQRLAKKLAREGWKIASIGKVQKLPETVYQDVKAASAAKLIESAMSKLTGKDNAVVQFNQDVLQTVADEIRARGFRSSMIHRKQGEVIRGYIEDPVKRHLLYINNMAGGVSKAQVARMAMEELLGQQVMGKQVGGIDPVKDPEAYKTATDYIAEQLRNLDNSDRIIGIAKSIATFKFLGFNIRSLAVNMTALVTTAPAAIHQYAMGGKGSFAAIFKELGVAGKDFGGYMAGRKLQNMEEQTFLDEMRRKGWDDPQYTRDALGTISKTHSRAWATAMNSSMYLFGKSEQFNRGATILAAYRLARKQGLTVGDAKERAKDATDKAHGVYGKATMPMWAQGTNPAAKIGQMLYVYGKFSHNYLQMLYDMGLKKHNIKGAMFAFLSPLVVAGGAALPFKGAIFGLAGAILSLLGWDDDPEKWVWDQIREHLGTGAETVARHGLTGAAGVDISGSLSIGVGIPKNIMDLSGAIGGSLETFATAFDAARSGSASKAIEAALPTGLANPIKAYRESNEGISTKRNYPVWDESGKQLMPTGGESVQKAVGFRSARQAVLSERTWEGKQQQTDYQGKRNALYQRYRSFILSGSKDRATYMKFVVDVREYNKKVRDAGLINMVPLITSESLKSQIRRMNNPTKRERAILEQ